MSYSSEDPTARFLFAILKQKNLRDIDWNVVAKDPVLAQPISNGHAARMRYSRLKTAIEAETKGRNPTVDSGSGAAKVSKSKKQSSSKRTSTGGMKTGSREYASGSGRHATTQSKSAMSSPQAGPDEHPMSSGRLLTPCSDATHPGSPQIDFSARSDYSSAHSPYDAVGGGGHMAGAGFNHLQHHHSPAEAWEGMPMVSEFETAFGESEFCRRLHGGLGMPEGFDAVPGMMDGSYGIEVKQEDF